MLNADLADTALASFMPDIAAECDSLADQLREALARHIPPAQQSAAFRALDAALENAGAAVGSADREQIAHGILHAVYGDTSHEPAIRIIAAAALKRFGRDGRSFQAIGDEFGVTRACVQAHSERIERRTGIKCRSDKNAAARETSRRNATGRKRTATGGIIRDSGLRRLLGSFRLRGV